MQDHPSSSMYPSNTHDAETWKAYWKAQGQPWRTEPEIDVERQKYLAQRRAIVPNSRKGINSLRYGRLCGAGRTADGVSAGQP